MSFITKRERVFNDYDLYDLPARNEGKLKAYASCTDARAWSHFCSDKSEHLVEIIKRNNETCRPKYVPTDAIVNTLMAAKNAEIGRLKHKIEEFEQMLAAYDQLELTCEQKCEIENAHAAIKAANKELNDLCLDLDLSGFTEGIDSEVFETGKSRGDEASTRRTQEIPKAKGNEWEFEKETTMEMESKANQTTPPRPRDASTSATDPRIDELQDVIISKDAKLSAMQNTLAVMENDICEPYCIYAHIYTALEKIFGTLCQNKKYKEYLDLLTAGTDTRGIDVKGKILFKLKVLEKFSLALIAPCSQEVQSHQHVDCSCYYAHVQTAFALTSPTTRNLNLDSKRALLVADIMENQEMKEILSKDSISTNDFKGTDDQIDESFGVDSYSVETENLTRLKNLQANYEELLNFYENLKYEKNCLIIKCKKYDEVEKELDSLRSRLKEYNLLWNEKEHYRKRSEDLDTLKEKYLVLSEETSNIETQLKAEIEINTMKTKVLDELRRENISLEKKLNDIAISIEKEKNILTCKCKEYECKIMCQEQQIKSLSTQIDQLVEHDRVIPSTDDTKNTIELTDQIESLNQQVKNLQNALFCDEEEKLQLKEEFQKNLELINNLRYQIEDWKNNYDKAVQSQNYLENYSKELEEENKMLTKEIENKSNDIDNFISIVNNKSQENEKLVEELERKRNENRDLYLQLKKMTENFDKNITCLENEKKKALFSLQLARTDSQKLIESYEGVPNRSYKVNNIEDGNNLEDNERCLMNIVDCDNENSILLQEIQKLRADNITNIGKLQDENTHNKKSLEILKKESIILKHKLLNLESLSRQFQNSHERLIADKVRLENELHNKASELSNIKHISRRDSETLIDRLQQSEDNYEEILRQKCLLISELSNKDEQLKILTDTLNELKNENEELRQESARVYNLEHELRNLNNAYENLTIEIVEKSKEIENLHNGLKNKIEENRDLQNQINRLQQHDISSKNSITALQNEKTSIQANLHTLRKESEELIDKLKSYEVLENNFVDLKLAYDQMKSENYNLQSDLEKQTNTLKNLQNENRELRNQSQNLLSHTEQLEESLINTRKELRLQLENPQDLLTIKEEIENLKQERNTNHQKIKRLLEKLDESDCIISKLTEDILARDDKIALLENHINDLQDEVQKLHKTLDELTEASEQMKYYSLQNIDQSLKRVEAHHSKATHNMRVEIAKLQNKNNMLEHQLSETRIIKEESMQDIHKYASQNSRLQNERKALATDIKKLEIKSVGDSSLSPNDCTVDDILESISKITKSFESRNLKNLSLEKTLLKVKTSFQLLVDKADEEKYIVEVEKQKLLNEKEAAITNLQTVEKELMDLKEKYKEEISRERCIINDLKAEISNQNLIINKINNSKEEIIFKLEEEIKALQSIYEISISKISELQDKVNSISLENNINLAIIQETNLSLEKKCKEIEDLKAILQNIKNKSVHSVGVTTETFTQEYKPVSIQTTDHLNKETITESVALENKTKPIDEINNINSINNNEIISELLPKNEPYLQNEVQILRANISSFFNSQNDYMDYKMKRLNFGPMEKCSISSLDNAPEKNNVKSYIHNFESSLKGQSVRHKTENSNIIDVYNVQPLYITSSQKFNDTSKEAEDKKMNITANLSSTSLCHLNKVSNNINNGSKDTIDVKKHKSDKDLFVIYKESFSNHNSPVNFQTNLMDIYNNVPLQQLKDTERTEITKSQNKKKRQSKMKSVSQIKEDRYKSDTYNDKIKLKIDLPQINTDSISMTTSSDGMNKSQDSYTYAIYSSPRKVFSDTNIESNQISSNIPVLGSPENLDKLSHEVKIHDIFIHNQSNDRNNLEPNIKLSNINETLIRVSSEQSSTENNLNLISRKKESLQSDSRHKLSRVGANVLLVEYSDYKSTNDDTPSSQPINDSQETLKSDNFGLQYILDTIKCENDPQVTSTCDNSNSKKSEMLKSFNTLSENKNNLSELKRGRKQSFREIGVLVKMDTDYESKIHYLTKTLENIEKDYKKKIDAVKMQYDSNIKNIINEHNQGVRSIQSLHEETFQDVLKIHENEVENLRSMSIEALRKVEKLEKENHNLKSKIYDTALGDFVEDEEPIKITTPETRKRKGRSRTNTKMLTKTNVEAFNVKPKNKGNGPCTCSVDMNISDTIRNIFEQVDVEQRKVAENTYLKYIANKISNSNMEALDAQELSFLHLKVCRTWKSKLSKEEALQKRIISLESELINKQRQTQQHMAELDRKVAEERRRLQEVREAVCRNSPYESRDGSPEPEIQIATTPEQNVCNCNTIGCSANVAPRRSAGDLGSGLAGASKTKRTKVEINRAVGIKLDPVERRDKKFYDDPPIRLKRSHDRPTLKKK